VTARATLKARARGRGESRQSGAIALECRKCRGESSPPCESRGSGTGNGKCYGTRKSVPDRRIQPSGRTSLVCFAKPARRVSVQSTHGPRIAALSFFFHAGVGLCVSIQRPSCSCLAAHDANAVFVVMTSAGLHRGVLFFTGRMVLGMCRSRGGLSCNSSAARIVNVVFVVMCCTALKIQTRTIDCTVCVPVRFLRRGVFSQAVFCVGGVFPSLFQCRGLFTSVVRLSRKLDCEEP